MPGLRQWITFASLPAIVGCASQASSLRAQCLGGQRRVSVTDTIKITHLVTPRNDSDTSHPAEDRVAWFSPDHRRFALLLRHADLGQNTNRYTLLVFRTRNALVSSRPEAVIRMSSSSNRPAIRDIRWIKDGRTLLFIGEHPGTSPQIYSFDVRERRLERVTRAETPIVAFDASGDGRVIVFEAEPPAKNPLHRRAVRRHGFVVASEDLNAVVIAGDSEEAAASASDELFVQIGRAKPRRIPIEDDVWPVLPFSVAPNGRYAVIEAFARRVPGAWLPYRERVLHEFVAAHTETQQFSYVETYLLLDTQSGVVTSLVHAPKAWPHGGVVWIAGGHSLVVSNSYLPLTGAAGAEKELREIRPLLVEIELPSRRIVKIGSETAVATAWRPASQELILEAPDQDHGAPVSMAYQKRGRGWAQVAFTPDASRAALPVLEKTEGMNAPPEIWIADPATKHRRLLLNLNPQFARLCFGTEREITWTAAGGAVVHGGLYLPPGYRAGQRYPLVIQTHGFDPDQFWIDGPWSSAFAAQALAARNIVVLQTDYDGGGRSTPAEAPRQMAAFEGAIDWLDAQGIIDRNRVGIVGFSRTVYHVAYTLTHSHVHFACAVLADGFDGGYFQAIAAPYAAPESDAVNGGPPFGDTLRLWLQNSPAFSIAAVDAPIRLESYGLASVVGQWEWYSLLSQRNKPVDFILLPGATHLLVKPWDRAVSLGGAVDWFSFWLNGEEDDSPGKREQWRRWRRLRQLEEEEGRHPAPS